MDWTPFWTAFSAIFTAAAAIAAAVAAGLSFRQVKVARDLAQIPVFESIFRDIRQQEQQFYGNACVGLEDKALRDRMFFNTVNYLAFLIDAKVLTNTEFVNFFRDAFLHWWTMFEEHVQLEDRSDPEKYSEFKRVVRAINPQVVNALPKSSATVVR